MSLLKARLNNAVNPAAGLEAGTEVSTVLGYVGPPPYVPPPGIAWRHDASYLGAVEYDPADFKTEPGLYVINFDGDGRDDLLARVAACYFRPSINGSEYGSPTSTTSTPARTIAFMAATAPSRDGKPAGR